MSRGWIFVKTKRLKNEHRYYYSVRMTNSLPDVLWLHWASQWNCNSLSCVCMFCTARQLNKFAVRWERSCQLHGTRLPVWLQVVTTVPQSFLHLGFSWHVAFTVHLLIQITFPWAVAVLVGTYVKFVKLYVCSLCLKLRLFDYLSMFYSDLLMLKLSWIVCVQRRCFHTLRHYWVTRRTMKLHLKYPPQCSRCVTSSPASTTHRNPSAKTDDFNCSYALAFGTVVFLLSMLQLFVRQTCAE